MANKEKSSDSTGYTFQRPGREWDRENSKKIRRDYKKYFIDKPREIQNNTKKVITVSARLHKAEIGYDRDIFYLAIYPHHVDEPIMELILDQPKIYPRRFVPELGKEIKILRGIKLDSIGFKYTANISDLTRKPDIHDGLPIRLIWKMEDDLPIASESLDTKLLIADIRKAGHEGFLYPPNPDKTK